MLERLSNAFGVSGNESDIRNLLLKEIGEGEIRIDTLGNIIVHKRGTGKKVMVAAHMDEVGLIITEITEKGFLKFSSVGGIDTRVLVSKRVFVGEKKIPGIIGMKAVHMQERAERETAAKEKSLYIDIGAKDKKEAEEFVSLGDTAVFDSAYNTLAGDFVKGKALDDRVGCRVLLDLLREDFSFDFYGVFTVQEEVGLRGAGVAAQRIMPDYALILEGTTCSDTYKTEKHLTVTKSGEGVAIPVMDRSAILDQEMVRRLVETAEKENIPYQFKRTTAGGTDAGIIHKTGTGVKTAILAVPVRYLHSPGGVMNLKDYEGMRSLSHAFLKRMEEEEWNF